MEENSVCLGEPQRAWELLSHLGLLTICPLPPGISFPLPMDTCHRYSQRAGPLSHLLFLTSQCPTTISDLELAQTPGPASCWADWDRTGSPSQEVSGIGQGQLDGCYHMFLPRTPKSVNSRLLQFIQGSKEREKEGNQLELGDSLPRPLREQTAGPLFS